MWWNRRGNSGGSWLPEEKKANMWHGRGNSGGSWPPAFPRSWKLGNVLKKLSRSGNSGRLMAGRMVGHPLTTTNYPNFFFSSWSDLFRINTFVRSCPSEPVLSIEWWCSSRTLGDDSLGARCLSYELSIYQIRILRETSSDQTIVP